MDPHLWTILQESFYRSYLHIGVKFSEHRLLNWGALRVAANGVPILPLFERYPSLVQLLSDRAQYIREWVWVFYATVYVDEARN